MAAPHRARNRSSFNGRSGALASIRSLLSAADSFELLDFGHEFLPQLRQLRAIKRASHPLAQSLDLLFDEKRAVGGHPGFLSKATMRVDRTRPIASAR
jgi:hypothetical protein